MKFVKIFLISSFLILFYSCSKEEKEISYIKETKQEFEIAIPINKKVSHLIRLKQDESGFKEIKKIEVN